MDKLRSNTTDDYGDAVCRTVWYGTGYPITVRHGLKRDKLRSNTTDDYGDAVCRTI